MSDIISRSRFLTTAGASALLASCASATPSLLVPVPSSPQSNKNVRRTMSVPAGYTTTHGQGTSSLYYNGSLVGTLTTDPTTFLTSFFFAPNSTTYKMTPPGSGQATVGGTYEPIAGATVTFPSSGGGASANVSSAGGTGYYTESQDSSGDYIGTMYHSTMITTVQRQNYGQQGGGGSGCGLHGCPQVVSEGVSAGCLLQATFALGATIGFLGAVSAALANPVFGLAEAGFLCAAHGFAVGEIAAAVYECMQ